MTKIKKKKLDSISHMELNFGGFSFTHVTPPGCSTEILAHPNYPKQRSIELSVFNEHRYAFFYWSKWTQEHVFENDRINHPPSLITLDWHQDLARPTTTEKKWLRKLNLSNNRDVALYSWANLGTLNDRHIMAAAYLNLIGDIYVHCRQGDDDCWGDEYLKDRFGNLHTVRKFKQFEELEAHMLQSDVMNVYFDLDLDFFTIDNPLNVGQKKNSYTYVPDTQIREMLSINRPLIAWIFERLWGITIALEPEHSGGFLKSQRLFALIDQIYFKPSLFTKIPGNWEKSTRWRHLSI